MVITDACLQIIHTLAPFVVSMSMHKFASNVIEKCLAFGTTQDRDLMVSLFRHTAISADLCVSVPRIAGLCSTECKQLGPSGRVLSHALE